MSRKYGKVLLKSLTGLSQHEKMKILRAPQTGVVRYPFIEIGCKSRVWLDFSNSFSS
jgi:hypothetical protein